MAGVACAFAIAAVLPLPATAEVQPPAQEVEADAAGAESSVIEQEQFSEEVICIGDSCQPLPAEPEDPTPGTLVPSGGNPPLRIFEPRQRPKKHRPKHHRGSRGNLSR